MLSPLWFGIFCEALHACLITRSVKLACIANLAPTTNYGVPRGCVLHASVAIHKWRAQWPGDKLPLLDLWDWWGPKDWCDGVRGGTLDGAVGPNL